MSNLPELRIGDALSQTSVQAVYQACGPAGTALQTVTVTYKAPKGERIVSVMLGSVPKDTRFDLDKMILKAGLATTDHLINAMRRAGFASVQAALVTQELVKMEDEES